MTRKPTLLVDEVEDSGGPHWLSAARRKLEAEEAKQQAKPKPKGLDQIRREHRTKYRAKNLRQRSVDEMDFMRECIELLTEEGADDPEYACQMLWDDGDESIIFERTFDEAKHPRDEDGKWTSGSGGDSDGDDDDIARSKSPASDLLAKNYKEEVPLDEIKAKMPAVFKTESVKAESEMKGKTITSKQFLGPDGKYTPERAALHRSIIRKLFTPDKIAAAVPKAGEKPTLTLSGGRPAAGKTTSLEKELGGKIQSSFYISADEIQEHLPGYQGRHAGLYNGEAQDIALQAEKVARHMGLNIIYDATLKSKQPALDRVQDYKEHGYEVDGYFIHTTPAVSAMRTGLRFINDKSGKGRYIPLEISYNSRTNESTFDSLIPHLRNWAIYDNNGTKPTRIVGTGL